MKNIEQIKNKLTRMEDKEKVAEAFSIDAEESGYWIDCLRWVLGKKCRGYQSEVGSLRKKPTISKGLEENK